LPRSYLARNDKGYKISIVNSNQTGYKLLL